MRFALQLTLPSRAGRWEAGQSALQRRIVAASIVYGEARPMGAGAVETSGGEPRGVENVEAPDALCLATHPVSARRRSRSQGDLLGGGAQEGVGGRAGKRL